MSQSGGDGADWLDQLEAKLEQTLEAFLRANPGQRQRLQEQMQRQVVRGIAPAGLAAPAGGRRQG